MTERKGLKKMVRERMARTGESYTTARRHVLAHAGRLPAPALPAGMVPGYDTFGGAWHRQSALLTHVLRQLGARHPLGEVYTEPMLAGLGGGIGFMYFVFDYTGMPPMMTIVAQHHPEPWAPAALGRLHVPLVEVHSAAPTAALKKLHAELDAGRPVLCTVDRSRLPWHGLLPGHGHDPYVVVVAGRDGDDLFIDDVANQPSRISGAEFAEAWSAHRKGRHHMLVPAGPPPSDLDLAAAARQAMATTVAHLTGPVLGNSFDVNFGFSGMAKLTEQLRDNKRKTGWARRFGEPVPFYHGLRRLYECLELQYTAPGATRPVYARFLTEVAAILPGAAAELTEAAALFDRSGAVWSRLAYRALETVDSLGTYADLAEQRMELICSGSATPDQIRTLNDRIDTLAAEHASQNPLGDSGRRALFDELAAYVDECLTLERQATKLLTNAP